MGKLPLPQRGIEDAGLAQLVMEFANVDDLPWFALLLLVGPARRRLNFCPLGAQQFR